MYISYPDLLNIVEPFAYNYYLKYNKVSNENIDNSDSFDN